MAGGKDGVGRLAYGDNKIGNDLDKIGTHQFCDKTMADWVSPETYASFMSKRMSGADMTDKESDEIADALLRWSTGLGAVSFSHIFYPVRSSGAMIGGAAGMKHDSFVDLDHGHPQRLKPITVQFGGGKLFTGETDGSSFPNGGLRATHTAAGFTSWDRTSPPWVYRGVLFIPCVLVSHYGKALDEKTPLLRSSDRISEQSLRLLKHTGFATDSQFVTINMGCEQGSRFSQMCDTILGGPLRLFFSTEFFIIDREMYQRRPDLINCGRTLIGADPPRGQVIF
jgi:glutamine synthetase